MLYGANRTPFLGDWISMPFRDAAKDVVLCDGGLSRVSYPEGVDRVALELRRVLADRGRCTYAPPERAETAEELFEKPAAGKIPNLSQFKLQIATVMQPSPVDDVTSAEDLRRSRPISTRWPARSVGPGSISGRFKPTGTARPCTDSWIYRPLSKRLDIEGFRFSASIGRKGQWGIDAPLLTS